MRFARLTLALALCALAAPSGPAAAAAPSRSDSISLVLRAPAPSVEVMTIRATPDTVPLGDLSGPANLTLAFAAAVGATTAAKGSKKVNLSQSYLFNGATYGPGNDIEVPGDFPDIDGETGEPIHPEGSAAARNAATSRRVNTRPMASPPSTGGVNTGEPATASGGIAGSVGTGTTVSGKSQSELQAMDKADLISLADEKGVSVRRLDDDGNEEDGEPRKADYVRDLGATATA
jgi:hypothetical protein